MTSPDADLALALETLGSSTRLALLRALRRPHILQDVRVGVEGRADAPALARQSVREHLDRLVAHGLVTTRDTEGPRGTRTEYAVNHFRVYELSEHLRELALLRPVDEPKVATATPEEGAAPPVIARPCVVLVRGLMEGSTFQLPARAGGVVTLGRSRSNDIPLDFDSFISQEHALVRSTARGLEIEDLASRNGTYVNFEALRSGGRRLLAHGDVIGLGRALLVYWS